MLMTGGGDGLHAYLADNLYMPVEQLDLATVLDLSQVAALREGAMQVRYFLALGAALREQGATDGRQAAKAEGKGA
ncbi:hypothetical protein D3C72_1780120 [compost metagenome]